MLQPSTYKSRPARTSISASARSGIVPIGRTRLTDFGPGQGIARTRRAAANERSGLLSGTGAYPAPWPMHMDAIGSHPVRVAVTTGLTSAGGGDKYMQPLNTSGTDYLFIAFATRLDRWALATGVGASNRSTALAATVVGMCTWVNKLYFALGASVDVKSWLDTGAGTLTASALGAGKLGYPSVPAGRNAMITAGGGVWTIDNAERTQVRTYSDGASTNHLALSLGGQWLNWAVGSDALYIATTGGINRITGAWGTGASHTFVNTIWGAVAPYRSAADDYAWMLTFQGRLFTWAGKTVIYYDIARETWRHAGLEGLATYAATVVNNILYVSIAPKSGAATFELWAYDGRGWWRIETIATNELRYISTSGSGQLVTVQTGSSANMWAANIEARNTAGSLISPVEIITPALDAQLPDLIKSWRKVGVETLRNDGQTAGNWAVAISTSIDAGVTWVLAGTESVTDNVETVVYDVVLSATQLMIKVTMTYTSGLPPHIIALWAEYQLVDPNEAEILGESARPRQWEFSIPARDDIVDRSGAADARTGQTIRATLRTLYDLHSTFPFRDVDYGADATTHTVRMTEMIETWANPADQAAIGAHSMLAITLEEVVA